MPEVCVRESVDGGRTEIQFQWMTRPPFDDLEQRRQLLRRLNEIPGVDLPDDTITRRPSIPLALLAQNDEALASFLRTLDWFRDTVGADGSAGD